MTSTIQTFAKNNTGFIVLERPKALNSLSLDMIRALTHALLAWREDPDVRAVVIRSSSEKAFCAGGDIRFFHQTGHAAPTGGSALLEDFFTEEYALNHLIHHYPKPYIALMDGIVMGGGMGISQAGPSSRLRIVTERTRMAMPEVHIGLFPDVGGSHFLSRTPGRLGNYLGVAGVTINAADALHAGLADLFLPSAQLPALIALFESGPPAGDARDAVRRFAAPFQQAPEAVTSPLSERRALIDRHFAADSVPAIMASLAREPDPFGAETLELMAQRSPLMMCVTLAQLRRGAALSLADCLRMERGMVRRSFEHGEVLEGVRARVIDKDNAPRWKPATLAEVAPEMVEAFFEMPWPAHAHPLRDLR
jgi:enoyl-CoA hydratase/carnithine racemase